MNATSAQDVQIQSRRAALLSIARWGLGWGVGAALLGLAAGYLFGGASWAGARRGLDWASLALFILAGCLVIGQSQSRPSDVQRSMRMGDGGRPITHTFTWGPILILVLGGAVCILIELAVRAVRP